MAFIYAYIPESPYWLAGRGYHDRGRAVIERLNGRIKDYDVDFHYGLLRQTVDLEQKHNRELTGGEETFWQTVKNTKEIFIGVNLRRTLIAFMPAAVQQLTGLAVLSSYSSYFAQVGYRLTAYRGNAIWLMPFRFPDGQLRGPIRVHLTPRYCIYRHHARWGGRY